MRDWNNFKVGIGFVDTFYSNLLNVDFSVLHFFFKQEKNLNATDYWSSFSATFKLDFVILLVVSVWHNPGKEYRGIFDLNCIVDVGN